MLAAEPGQPQGADAEAPAIDVHDGLQSNGKGIRKLRPVGRTCGPVWSEETRGLGRGSWRVFSPVLA